MPERTPKSELTLSAVPDGDPDRDRIAAAIVERYLALIDRATSLNSWTTAEHLIDRLIMFVWGDA